jgi:outer membrane protein TolC
VLAGLAVLDRSALVATILERNPSIEAARQAWRAALARHPQVTALEDPVLGYGVAPRSFGVSRLDDAHVVDVSQAIPFPGKLGLRGEVARAEADAARGDLEAVRLRLATMGSLLFDDHYFVMRALEINARHARLLEELQRSALSRYEAGEASQQDPLQAETELARIVQRDLELRAQQRVVGQRLNTLLHRPVDAALPPAPSALAPPALPFAPQEAEPLADAALGVRPELEAAEARVRARAAQVRVARHEFLPDFTLVANYNARLPIRENRPFVGVRLNVPLQLGRRRAALDEARAQLARAESERAAMADEVRLSVHRALEEYQQARAVAALFDARLLPTARDRVGAARVGFETGRNGFLELIDAQRELLRIELDREQAATEVSRNAAELLAALGHRPGDTGVRP